MLQYYRVDFKLKEEAMGTQDAEEFIPAIVCVLQELHEILDMQINHCDSSMCTITSIRLATEEEAMNLPHFYI
jgi:hypothetical protein